MIGHWLCIVFEAGNLQSSKRVWPYREARDEHVVGAKRGVNTEHRPPIGAGFQILEGRVLLSEFLPSRVVLLTLAFFFLVRCHSDAFIESIDFLVHLVDRLAVSVGRLRHTLCFLAVFRTHGGTPAEAILGLAQLNGLELCEQLQADGPGILLALVDVCDLLGFSITRHPLVVF